MASIVVCWLCREMHKGGLATYPLRMHSILEVCFRVERQRHQLEVDHLEAVGSRHGPPGNVELCDLDGMRSVLQQQSICKTMSVVLAQDRTGCGAIRGRMKMR